MSEPGGASGPEAAPAGGGARVPLLEAQGVEKEYRSRAEPLRVLKGVNLTIQRGETVAFVVIGIGTPL